MLKRKGDEIEVESLKATAVRAVYDGPRMPPRIRFTFHTTTRDKVVVEMDLNDASLFIQQGIAAIEASATPVPRPTYHTPFG